MTIPLVIVGCGGHGRETFAIASAVNAVAPRWRLAGFVDDAPSPDNRRLVAALGAEVIGGVEELIACREPAAYVIGIGDGRIRARIDARLTQAGWQPATLVHPDTSIGPDVVLGPGTVVWAGVRAATNIRCGRHVHLNHNVTLGHDAVLDDYASVNPQASVAGGVHLNAAVTVGAAATVLQYLTVGRGAVVGAGAVVVHSVAAGVTVKGVPAR